MFSLPDLPYAYDALEPYIDEETMHLHHDKHHASYVDNLNKLIKGDETIEELLKSTDQAMINNLGGHLNHTLYWETMSPKPQSLPQGSLKEVIDSTFGSFDNFKEEFTKKALTVFGSGWVFLIKTKDGDVQTKRHSFQNNPRMHGNTPLLGIDVWEHAYYLKYKNVRADYIKAWWNAVDWEKVEENYEKEGGKI